MEKVEVALEFVNIAEGTFYTVPVTGYKFEATTKDGKPVKVVAYKYNGGWLVNDLEGANSKAINVPRSTRKEAVSATLELFSRVDYETFQNKLNAMKGLKQNLKQTEVSA